MLVPELIVWNVAFVLETLIYISILASRWGNCTGGGVKNFFLSFYFPITNPGTGMAKFLKNETLFSTVSVTHAGSNFLFFWFLFFWIALKKGCTMRRTDSSSFGPLSVWCGVPVYPLSYPNILCTVRHRAIRIHFRYCHTLSNSWV